MKTSTAQGAALLASLHARLLTAVKVAETQSLEAARYELEATSRGTLSPGDLRRLDHPYARRHGSPLRNPAILNQKSGETARSWHTSPVSETSEGTQGSVVNRSPAAKWIKSGGKGSSKMVERPIVEHVKSRIRAEREARLASAIKSVLKEF